MRNKENPCNITILETYASQKAYRSHIASKHFQKYKQGTYYFFATKPEIIFDFEVQQSDGQLVLWE